MITILDYGLGNIKAIANVYYRAGIPFSFGNSENLIRNASKLILPGVGSFDYAMQCLNNSKLRDVVEDLVINKSVPILGICVGMQILAESSEEGTKKGLGWIKGNVVSFANYINNNERVLLPHMGWNTVNKLKNNTLFDGINDGQFYFLHSYFFKEKNKDNILSTTDYFINFTSTIHNKNIYGVQFHPEKSHHYGQQLLINFAKNNLC